MPTILHPQVVHFVIAGLLLGLPLYWLSFLKRGRFLRSTGSILLLVGTVAAWVAVDTGLDAHRPAEAIPGAREVVQHHEELGELTRNIFTGVLLVELIALGLMWKAGSAGSSVLEVETGESNAAGASTTRFAATALSVVVAIAWAVGVVQLYETAEHGGQIVYDHAGGVGFKQGQPEHVENLLLAGLFQESRQARDAGRHDEAARLVDEMIQQFPGDAEVQMLGVESQVLDRKDGRAALDALAGMNVPADNMIMQLRKQTYAFDAYMLLDMPDSARAALDAVPERFENSRMVTQRREQLGG